MEFKSQICTTREQSERLLALGLKKETADCALLPLTDKVTSVLVKPSTKDIKNTIPAWSLHRLLSLLPTEIKCDVENGLGIYLGSQNDVSYFGVLGYYSCENLYDAVILCIEDVIKEGYFNKDYLEETK